MFEAQDGPAAGPAWSAGRARPRQLDLRIAFDRSPQSFNEAVELMARGGADLAICKLSRALHRAGYDDWRTRR